MSFTISGRIIYENGRAPANAVIHLISVPATLGAMPQAGAPAHPINRIVTIAPAGGYTIEAVPSGRYQVEIRSDGATVLTTQLDVKENITLDFTISLPLIEVASPVAPVNLFTYRKSVPGVTLKYYSCFISYSTKDQAFADQLYADLQAKGVDCWYAPHDIQGGKKIHEQIDQAIRIHDKLLLVLSKHSMDSEWVKTEIYNARQLEAKENKRKLFPISLTEYDQVRQWRAFDADIGKDMAREVREYYIPDFTHWKDHDAYQKAFDRLLRDLKAQG